MEKRNKIILFSYFLLFNLNLINSKLVKENVVYAVNCGGNEYIDDEGIMYHKDNNYDGGVMSDYGLNYDIVNTKDMELYQTERWHQDTFTYSIPLREPGKYVLILKFSEVYFNSPGDKVFDIAMGKKVVIKDIDVFARVGKAAAHDEYVEFEVKDDKVYVNRGEAPGAYDSKSKQLKVKFVKGAKDNPKINAILLYKGDIYDTDYAEIKRKQEEANRKKLQEAKKGMLIELRHHPDEVYDEDAALNEDDSILLKDEPGLLSIFFTVQGAFILLSLGAFLALNYALELLETQSSPRKRIKKE
jgi:hypothetical protein